MRFLPGGKINPTRSPADEAGIFVKSFRQNLGGTAFRGDDDGELHIGVEEIFRARNGLEGNLFSVGRPLRVGVRPGRADNLFYSAIAYRHHVYVSGHRGDQIGIFLRAESDARAVRRPGKLSDAEFVALGQPLRVRDGGVSRGYPRSSKKGP